MNFPGSQTFQTPMRPRKYWKHQLLALSVTEKRVENIDFTSDLKNKRSAHRTRFSIWNICHRCPWKSSEDDICRFQVSLFSYSGYFSTLTNSKSWFGVCFFCYFGALRGSVGLKSKLSAHRFGPRKKHPQPRKNPFPGESVEQQVIH